MLVGSWVRGGGGAYLKIENGDGSIFKFLNGNNVALIDISMICMCNKIKNKAD